MALYPVGRKHTGHCSSVLGADDSQILLSIFLQTAGYSCGKKNLQGP